MGSRTITFFLVFICLLATFLRSSHADSEEYNVSLWSSFEDFGPDWVLDDMIIPLKMFDVHSGITTDSLRWPNKTIVYTLNKSLNATAVSIIRSTMDGISKKTCVEFREKKQGDEDWIEITGESHNRTTLACDATVGHRGGRPKKITLGDQLCLFTPFLHHELAHAMGILHEHQRPDRDDYVMIHWDNIPDDAKANFGLKYPSTTMDMFDLPYDYQSVMHYPTNFFAIDPSRPTISRKDCPDDCQVGGEAHGFSPIDYEKINRMYNCP